MGKYFGTDGFRGEAGITLTADHAYKVGRFLGWYYNVLRERNGDNEPARIVIGKDTRRSSYMFEYSLVAGLTASGADAYLLHVTTTPSVAYIARVDDFDCGIMISASHNPYYDNGIKLIDCYGEKMPEETLLLVEDYIDGKLHVFDKDWPELPFAHREHIGCTVDYVAGRNRYMGYLISLGIYSFKGVKVGLDCANGSSWNIAKSVFDALGADTYPLKGKVYCGYCQKLMKYRVLKKLGPSFNCRFSATAVDSPCKRIPISEELLEEIVRNALTVQIKQAEHVLEILHERERKALICFSALERQEEKLSAEKAEIVKQRVALYEQYADGNISKEEFVRQRDAYRAQEDEKMEQIQRLRTEKNQAFQPVKRDTDHLQTVISTVEEAGDVMHLSQNVVETFIDRIEVFNDERVKIHFTFEDTLNSYEEK